MEISNKVDFYINDILKSSDQIFMAQKDMISVIVPFYDAEQYLERCLNSLYNQTYKNVEFILIDDGSTDSSKTIIDNISDNRFRIFHNTHQGLSAARNFGIEEAYGEWIMFVDSDDYVEFNFCETAINAAKICESDLVIFKYYEEKTIESKGREGINMQIE